MRRRIVGLVALAIALTPLALGAQQPTKVARIGYLSLHSRSEVDEAFRQGLRDHGWLEGQNIAVELSAKRLELLKETIPGIARVAVLVNPGNPQAPFLLKETKAAASALGLRLQVLEVRRPDDVEKAFAAINRREIDAVLVLPDPLHNVQATQARIASLAAKGGLPVMAPYRGNAEAGALISYGTNLPDLFRRGAVYVDKILKGAKPGDLPVQQPTKFKLVINLRTVKALGLTIPNSVLVRADEVIQ